MSQGSGDRLYGLLPVIYRQRDEALGQPLRALLAIIENEFATLEIDLAATYDNWFIETCESWVIPYLADFVGIEGLEDMQGPILGLRRLVANHIAYQRRKGLSNILAHAARDVSGWHAYVSESSQRVAQTQAVKNIRLTHGKTVDMRQGEQLALLGTPFDSIARTVDVRRVDADTQSGSRPGLASLNALALYLWRTQSYPVLQAQAGIPPRIRRGKNTRHFTFDPLGRDLALFIQPEAMNNLTDTMRPAHFPNPLTRMLLAADLAQTASAERQQDSSRDLENMTSRYYGPQRELALWIGNRLVPAQEVLCGQLNDSNTAEWDAFIGNLKDQGEIKSVVVDPENGRILLAKPTARDGVTVNYTYGFSRDLGSGPYQRDLREEADKSARQEALQIDILKSSTDANESETLKTASSLKQALDFWQEHCETSQKYGKPPQAIIRFLDSSTYHLPGPLQIRMPSGSYLSIEAAPGERPTIIAESGVLMAGPPEEELIVFDRRLRLQGLLVAGPIVVPNLNGGKLGFQIIGCTLLNELELHIAETVLFDLAISGSIINSSIIEIASISPDLESGLITDDHRKGSLMIEDCIVAGNVTTIVNSMQPYQFDASLNRSTVLGKARLSSVSQVEDSILMDGILVEKIETDQIRDPKKEQIVMRYSYVQQTNLEETMHEYCVVGTQLRPLFTSTQPTHSGFAQLQATCPKEIRYGASNGAEMGVFNSLHANRREANLKRMLPDYLPLGQNIGIFTVT